MESERSSCEERFHILDGMHIPLVNRIPTLLFLLQLLALYRCCQVQRGTMDTPAALRAARQAFPFLEMLARWAWRCKLDSAAELEKKMKAAPRVRFVSKKVKRAQAAAAAAAEAAGGEEHEAGLGEGAEAGAAGSENEVIAAGRRRRQSAALCNTSRLQRRHRA